MATGQTQARERPRRCGGIRRRGRAQPCPEADRPRLRAAEEPGRQQRAALRRRASSARTSRRSGSSPGQTTHGSRCRCRRPDRRGEEVAARARGRRGPDADAHNEQLRERTDQIRARPAGASISDDHRAFVERGRVGVAQRAVEEAVLAARPAADRQGAEYGGEPPLQARSSTPSSKTRSVRATRSEAQQWVQPGTRGCGTRGVDVPGGRRDRHVHRGLAGRRQRPVRLPHRCRPLSTQHGAPPCSRSTRTTPSSSTGTTRTSALAADGPRRTPSSAARSSSARKATARPASCSTRRASRRSPADGDPTGLPEGYDLALVHGGKAEGFKLKNDPDGGRSTRTSPPL
jgi:hypothetical protein